jgi:benzoate-CoA ligase family protein
MLNMATYFLDENLKQGRGERPAVYYKNQVITYDDICQLTNRVGNALKNLGVEPENRVYLVLDDSPELVAAFYGTIKIGAVATMAYTFLKPHDYERELDYIRPKVVFADGSAIEGLREASKGSRYPKSFVVLGRSTSDLQENEFGFHESIEVEEDKLEPEPTSEDDIALWKFSGGTTGFRTAIPHRHADAVFAFEAYDQIVHYRQDDVVLSVPKMFFGYGRDGTIVFPFRVGASAVLFPERFTPERLFELVRRHHPSILVQVPTAMRAMLDSPRKGRPDFSCIRLATSAGEALSPDLYGEWKKTFGCEVLDGIGSAEMYYVFISNRQGDVVPGTLGRIVPGYEAEIVSDEGKALPDGEIGILRVKGGSSGIEYYYDRFKTQKTFRGEWVYTDDLFSKDGDGYFRFAGRRDDLLKVSGYFVSPYEIEECIANHPEVAKCAVVGVQDEDGLIKSKAFVVLKPTLEPTPEKGEELKQFCKLRLASYKFPRFVEFLSHLPETGLGKVDRFKLKQRGI